MFRLRGSRRVEAPRRHYAIHDVWRREIVLVRVVQRPHPVRHDPEGASIRSASPVLGAGLPAAAPR
jgi:hypothetical protein